MTQKAKNNKSAKKPIELFLTKSQKDKNGNIYTLSHKFWTNQDSDMLSISNWPSEPEFCERLIYIWQKNGQKGS